MRKHFIQGAYMFSNFAKWMSGKLGNSKAFMCAILAICLWAVAGPYFQYSDTWQLVINTGTTIITFLMVFLLQNTQNRDTLAIHLKLDEIIRAIQSAHNELMDIEGLTDEELRIIHKRYETLAKKIKENTERGMQDLGSPQLDPSDHQST